MNRPLDPQTRRAAELVGDCLNLLMTDAWDWNGNEFAWTSVTEAAEAMQDAADDDVIFRDLDRQERTLLLRGWRHLAWLVPEDSATVRDVSRRVQWTFQRAVFASLERAEQYRAAGFTAVDARELDKDNPTADEIAFLGALRYGTPGVGERLDLMSA